MALAPVQLDDLSWREMVESVRRRIPGASDGAWTHHAPVDPGITLLELFAWLIEQRLFWIDQIPDDLTRALFALAGHRATPPQSAATVLACQAPPGAPFHDLAPGVAFRFSSAEAPRVFTTRTGATLAPIARAEIRTAAGTRSADARTGRPITLMGDDGAASQFAVVLWFTAPPAAAPAEKLGLLVELDTDRVKPQWAVDAPPSPPAPTHLTWSYSLGSGSWRDFTASEVEDGTGGLRRSGLVRLPIANGWAPNQPVAGAQTPLEIRVRTERASFTVPPRLLALSWNAVIADHWSQESLAGADAAEQARGWLKLPGQRLRLAAEAAPVLPASVELKLREADGVEAWTPADDFAFTDRFSRVFVVDRAVNTLIFGDGIAGRVPVPRDPGAPEIDVRYRAGGGLFGNLARRKRWQATDRGVAIEASNVVDALGGAEAETLDETSRRLAGRLRRPTRAVTKADFETIALGTPGVALARALPVVGLHPLHPCARTPGAITVFIVPFAPRPEAAEWAWPDPTRVAAPAPDPGALVAVQAELDGARLVTAQVFVRPIVYRPVSIRVDLAATPADPDDVERRLGARLSRFLDPLAGGDAGQGLPFGEPVRPSALLRVAQQALMGDLDVAQVAVGLDGAAAGENCRDLAIGPYQLAYLQRLTVVAGTQPTTGGLP